MTDRETLADLIEDGMDSVHDMDVFDNAIDPAWRDEAFAEMASATNTRIQMLTKRIGNVEKMVPEAWKGGNWPDHIGLMITVVNQAEADHYIPELLDLKFDLGIPWVGLSMEPLLGPVDLTAIPDPSGLAHSYMDALRGKFWMPPEHVDWPVQSRPVDGRLNVNLCGWLDWVICGGESGPNARPMHPNWSRSLRDQCQAAGVAFHFKQWGEWQPYSEYDETNGPALHDEPPTQHPDATTRNRFDAICMDSDGTEYRLGEKGQFPKAPHGAFAGPHPMSMHRVGKKSAGRLLDGREWNEVPDQATSNGEAARMGGG